MARAETDSAASGVDVYNMNPSTGTLALNCSCSTEGNGAQGIAVDPFGKFTLIANTGSNDVSIGVPDVGELATIAAGMSPVAITFDPTYQVVYVANSGDNTVSSYVLSIASPYLTPSVRNWRIRSP